MQVFADERVRECQHHGHVRARRDREPLGADEPGKVVAHGAHQHELGAALARPAQMIARRMPAGAAGADHRVLDGDAAEAEEELRVALEHRPRRRPVEELAHRADHVRHDDRLRPVAIGVLAAHVPTQAVQEAMELRLRVVEASGAAPAVGSPVDARTAVALVDAAELEPQPIDGGRPADGHERLGAAARVGAGASIEPAGADHRLRDPRAMTQTVDDVAEQRGGIGVVAIGVNRHDRAVRDFSFECAPVRRVRNELARHARQDIKAGCAVARSYREAVRRSSFLRMRFT